MTWRKQPMQVDQTDLSECSTAHRTWLTAPQIRGAASRDDMIILDGKSLGIKRRAALADWVATHLERAGRPPGLTVLLAGDDAASATYVRSKEKASAKAGIRGDIVRLPSSVTENELLARIEALNVDPEVDGILVQLPLPEGLDEDVVLDAIAE